MRVHSCFLRRFFPTCLLVIFVPVIQTSWASDNTSQPVLSAAAGDGPVTASEPYARRLKSSCLDCHSGEDAEASIDLEGMLREPIRANLHDWRKVHRVLRDASMPPENGDTISQADRATLVKQTDSQLRRAAGQHARDPGPTVVRRLTSAEFDYCIEDLTGLTLGLGEQFLGDSVGGSGFTNSASAQFFQDAILERYLEAAKTVANHAIIGAGSLGFYEASGQTGMELSAIGRIQSLYRQSGFRASAGEGAEPYGLDRFPRALEVTWRYRHREALGIADQSLQQLSNEADLNPKFVRHLWNALHRPDPGFPLSEVIVAWNDLPAPKGGGIKDGQVDLATDEDPGRGISERCLELFEQVQAWQRRFAGAASAEEEAAILTGGNITIPSQRSFVVQARRKRIQLDDNFTPDLNNPRLYDEDGTIRLRITVEAASSLQSRPPSVIFNKATFQYRYLEQVNPEPVPLHRIVVGPVGQQLRFGENLDGEPISEDAFSVRVGEEKIVEAVLPPECNLGRLEVEARLDSILGEHSVVRCVIEDITDQGSGSSRRRQYSSLLRDQSSEDMKQWEAGLTSFARTFPQISHREPAPSDRDPIPVPYDNTYNVPERNYFHTAVKYHREDDFLVQYLLTPSQQKTLNEAWADLLLSFDYHDVNLRFVARKYGVVLPVNDIASCEWTWIQSLPDHQRQPIAGYKSQYEAMVKLMRAAESRQLDDLMRLAARAWRRPLLKSEQEELIGFYRSRREQEGLSHRDALRASITRVLVAPQFLFRIETTSSDPADQPLSDYELASRLSFSLWSSLPDETLLELAQMNSLSDERILRQQVQRMLASSKARRFATEFFGQWLGFYQFDRYRGVDQQRFPEFDAELRASLYNEAISLCEHLIRQDRPYHELIETDYSFVDQRVAEHYGLKLKWPEDHSSGPLKISLGSDQPRGGVLGLGAILITTSAPLRTSPVKRGDWILRRLLGTPVPPPPADAGSIPADDVLGDGKTVRERLEAHRDRAACRGCHVRIDPLGFALEHYDSLGRYRGVYRDGQEIDTTGKLRDGREIQGLAGLKSHLRERDEEFRRTLAANLAAYILGRPEAIHDTALIEKVADGLAENPSFSSAICQIVLSPQFRRIRGAIQNAGNAPSAPSKLDLFGETP